jgi:hypothetical protein
LTFTLPRLPSGQAEAAWSGLVVYNNGARLGVAVTGLTGELFWVVAMDDRRNSARITGMPPPAVPVIT